MKAQPLAIFTVTDARYFLSHREGLGALLRRRGFEVAVAAPEEAEAIEQLRQRGYRFLPWRLDRRSLSPWSELRSIVALWRLYSTHRPTLVHHVDLKPVTYGTIAARAAGVRAVINAIAGLGIAFSLHGPSVAARVVLTVSRLLRDRSRWITIFQNPDDCRLFIGAGAATPARARVIRGSGVDPQVYVPADHPVREPVITVPCRMIYDKGVAEVVEAARTLRERGIAVRVELAGGVDSGNPNAIPEEVLRGWDAAGLATWLGKVADMRALYHRTRVVCLPSYYGEGVPRALIEAASCGLPIVTADTPGCREIVMHGFNGARVPPRNVRALADALAELLRDDSACDRMGRNGRAFVQAAFSINSVITAHDRAYRAALGVRPTRTEAA